MDGGFKGNNDIMVNFIKAKVFICGLWLFLVACEKENKVEVPDVSHIEVTIDIRRFEEDLFAMVPPLNVKDWDGLQRKYPVFLPLFVDKVLGMEGQLLSNGDKIKYLEGFISFPELMKLKETVETQYGDFMEMEASFKQALQYY